MTRQQHRLGLAVAVPVAGLALLVLLLALAVRSSGQGDSGHVAFPLVLGGLVAVATLLALVWRAVTVEQHADS